MSDPRTELAAAGARLAALGLSPGSSGNLSVRIDDHILITPTGADLAHVDPDGLSVLAPDGTHLDGPRPSKEFPCTAPSTGATPPPAPSSICTPGTPPRCPAWTRGRRGARCPR